MLACRARGASDADLAVFEHQLDTWQALTPDEGAHSVRVDTSLPLDRDDAGRKPGAAIILRPDWLM